MHKTVLEQMQERRELALTHYRFYVNQHRAAIHETSRLAALRDQARDEAAQWASAMVALQEGEPADATD